MPGLTLTFTVAAAVAHAIAIGSCFCGGNDDDSAPRNSYHSSSSSNRGTSTRIQTQPSYRPPPLPPSRTYRPSETNAHQTTPSTPAPSDHGRGVYRPSVVSPHTQTPSQTQLSSSRTQSSIAQSASTSSRAPLPVPTERDPLLPTGSSVRVNHPSVVTRTPSEAQPSSTRTQPSRPHASLFDHVVAQSALTSSHVPPRVSNEIDPLPTVLNGVYHSSSSVVSPYTRTPRQTQPSSALTQPSSTHARLSSALTQSSSRQQSSALTPPSSTHAPPSSNVPQPSRPSPSPFAPVLAQIASTSSRVPSSVPPKRDPLLPVVIQVVSSDVEDLDFAKKLREQARRRGREMSEARSRAKSAQKKRSRGAAQVHRQEAIAHESAMKELDKRAAKIIFRENNKNRKEGTIDLHGLYVAEAVRFAKEKLQSAISRNDDVVRFIVGKGLHSDAGGAKIRPALEGLFIELGLIHSLDPKNAGVLVVRLDWQ